MASTGINGRLVASFAATLGLVVAAVVPLLLQQISATIMRAETRELHGISDAFAAQVATSADTGAAMAWLVATMPDAQAALAAGDRDRLVRMFQPGYAQLKERVGVDQFQFHAAPATSFLRMHLPGKFGDDLSSFRQTVVDANRSRQPAVGLESGVGGLGVRGVVPVSRDGQALGTVEFGMSVGKPFVEAFKKRFGVDLALHVKDPKADGLKILAQTTPDVMMSEADLRQAMAGQEIIRQGELAGRPIAALAAPVLDYSGKPVAAVEIILDASDYVAQYSQARTIASAIGAVALLAGLAIVWVLARGISAPLVGITRVMHRLADGELGVEVPSTARTDEVGEMARAVQVFKHNAVEKLRIEEESRILREAEDEARQVRDRAASEHAQGVKARVDEVDRATGAISHTAQGMSQRSERSGSLSLEMGEAARITSERAGIVSEATRQLSLAVDEIAAQVSNAHDITRKAVAEVSETALRMDGLSNAVQAIGQIVGMIQGIAAQTRMLALNATIEAARAGEAGKGFAVVADEVKHLADQTSKATDDIARQVSAIQDSTKVMADSITDVVSVIRTLDEVSSTIAGAVQQQDASTREIAEHVGEVARQADVVSDTVSLLARTSAKTCAGTIRVMWSAKALAQTVDSLTGETEEFLARMH